MKIENILLNNLLQNSKLEILREHSIFKGRIVNIKENTIIINVRDYGMLEAILDIKGSFSVGDQVLFLVKSIDNNKIYVKPVDDENNTNNSINLYNKHNSVEKLLKDLKIEKNEMTIGLIEKLMEHNLPINKDIVNEGIRTLEKLIQLINLSEEKNEGKNVFLPDISLLNNFTLEDIDKIDIKHLLISDDNVENNLSNIVKELLNNNVQLNNEKKIIKIISFLIKNNLTSSLRNIKYIAELDNNPMEFIKEFQEIFSKLNKEHFSKKVFKESTFVEHIEDEVDSGFKIISTKEEDLKKLEKIFAEVAKDENQSTERIKELENKLDFLKELNKEAFFVFFPINNSFKDKLDGLMTLIKEKKKKGIGNRISVFINLDTNNLGNIKVLCNLFGNSINITLKIREEDLELFKITEKKLIEKILTIGYSVKGIEYVIDKDISLIDSLKSKSSSSYILDLKV